MKHQAKHLVALVASTVLAHGCAADDDAAELDTIDAATGESANCTAVTGAGSARNGRPLG